MRLIRFGQAGQERPGVLLSDGRRLDLENYCKDFSCDFFAEGGADRLRRWVRDNEGKAAEVDGDVRLGPPIPRPGKIICVGLNYAAHAREFMGREVPDEPVLFMKASSAVCGSDDDLVIPTGSHKLDYEVELAMVIGKLARNISEDNAMDHVAGFCMINDVSDRSWQKEHEGQWTKGKSADGFAPLGPWLVTTDEIEDPDNLMLWLDVNGEPRQRGNTNDMIFSLPSIVSYISRFMTLEPGDVIATGTPSGVAMAMKPPQWLQPGDVIEMGIDGLGTSRRKVVKAEDAVHSVEDA